MEITKITDEDVRKALRGEISNKLLRELLCSKKVNENEIDKYEGVNASEIDMTELSPEMFKYLSFDEKTVFSDEQRKKFSPEALLENGKTFSKSMEKIHESGVTGKGLKVAIIDTNLQIKSKEYFESNGKNIQFDINEDEKKSGIKEVHGATVLSSFLSVAPDSNVLYIACNKYDKEHKDENFLSYIEDIIKNHSDVVAVSISASFLNPENREKAKKMLEEAGIVLIDSPEFYNNFTYSRKDVDEKGDEHFEETFCEEDEKVKDIFDRINSYIKMMNFEDLDRKEAVTRIMEMVKLNGTEDDKNQVKFLEDNPDIAFAETVEEMIFARKKALHSQEKSERKERNSVEIPCGGRTFMGNDGVFKYFATASASYTIPQLTALYVLAKETNPNIKYDEFVKICKETSTLSRSENGEYDRYTINPDAMLLEVSKLKENEKRDLRKKVIVPIRRQFKEIAWKNIKAKPESILTLQNYMQSMNSDSENEKDRTVPIGIFDTIKEKLGISKMEYFLDGEGKVFIRETNGEKDNLISFSSLDECGEYIDYLTKLGIYCKLYDKKVSISRSDENSENIDLYIATNNYSEFKKEGSNFEKTMLQNPQLMKEEQIELCSDEFSIVSEQDEIWQLSKEELKKKILEKFSTMDVNDIASSNISQYEFRKIIGIKCEDIDISQDEINALSLYKHGWFDYINGFLRGDLSFLNNGRISKEKFIRDYLPQIIDCVGKISNVQKKFISDKDMTLIRRDSRINENTDNKLEYDNFVSTSASPKLFSYALDGINKGGIMVIKVPKGTPIIPMDIVTEKNMLSEKSVNIWGGGDVGYEESEMLIPMCDIEVSSKNTNENGMTTAYTTVLRQKDPIEVLERRIQEISDIVIQYGGEEKLEELNNKLKSLKEIEQSKKLRNEINDKLKLIKQFQQMDLEKETPKSIIED